MARATLNEPSIEKPATDDPVLPFSIDGTDIRGQIARLGPAVDSILSQHAYPPVICHVLGEALVLAALLGPSLKFDGKLTLQIQGDGPVRMLVADFHSSGAMRGYVSFDKQALEQSLAAPLSAQRRAEIPALFGEGRLALTIDQGLEKETYQGIVELTGDSLAQSALAYFGRSEQILTAVKLGVARHTQQGGQSQWRAGGIIAQSLPAQMGFSGETDDISAVTERSLDDWERVSILLETTTDDELTDPTIAPEKLLYRLFHEEGPRVFEAKSVHFACPCSSDKILDLLTSFSAEDRAAMVENGKISVCCEFCNSTYDFNPEKLILKD